MRINAQINGSRLVGAVRCGIGLQTVRLFAFNLPLEDLRPHRLADVTCPHCHSGIKIAWGVSSASLNIGILQPEPNKHLILAAGGDADLVAVTDSAVESVFVNCQIASLAVPRFEFKSYGPSENVSAWIADPASKLAEIAARRESMRLKMAEYVAALLKNGQSALEQRGVLEQYRSERTPLLSPEELDSIVWQEEFLAYSRLPATWTW